MALLSGVSVRASRALSSEQDAAIAASYRCSSPGTSSCRIVSWLIFGINGR